MTKSLKTRLVEFGALPAALWTSGALRPTTPMQSHEWISAAGDVYGQGPGTRALVVGDAECPRAVAVLGQSGRFGGLRLAGSIDIGESVEVLGTDDAALDDLARGLTRLGVAIDLGHYPARQGFSARLRRQQGRCGWTFARPLPDRAFPTLPLDASWTQPLDHCSRSRRQQYRRKWRKAEAMGPVEVEICAPRHDEVDALFARAMAVEAQGWKGREGTALSHDPKQADFLMRYGRLMAAQDRLRLCFLTVGGEDAAMTYAVVWDNRFWAIKVGYDDGFSAISPGEALLVALIRDCAEQGHDAFEFCGKEAAWTRAWTTEAVEIQALRFYPWTVAGIGRLAFDGIDLVRRRLGRARTG